jgi:DNA-binding NarL/FixJ family response regulator
VRALVADDHPLVRDALARTLAELEPGVDVVTAGDFDAALAAVQGGTLDLALVDWQMPGMDGLHGLQRLRAAMPTLPIVVASGHDDAATIRAALGAGAAGFIPKSEQPAVLMQALRLVRAGGVYVPARLLDAAAQAPAAPAPPSTGDLTARQLDVLDRLLRGEPNKLIARELGLTEGTVKIHIAAILRTLQVRNRTEAVVRARELGLGRDA